MLILTRKIGEAIVLGDDLAVRVLGIKGSAVRIGIVAPRSTNIVREELLEEDSARYLNVQERNVPTKKKML